MRDRSLAGLRDKLYWRHVWATGDFCCFKRTTEKRGRQIVLVSLCGRHERIRSGGQASRRPESILRCARCDIAEMKRRGWDESGPTLEPRIRSLVPPKS